MPRSKRSEYLPQAEEAALARGTRYALPHEPFVLFDVMHQNNRECLEEVLARNGAPVSFTMPKLLHIGGPIDVASVLPMLTNSGHGALDPVEGAVWRVEHKGKVDFLAKYVRQDKVDGCYLEIKTNAEPVWNWRP